MSTVPPVSACTGLLACGQADEVGSGACIVTAGVLLRPGAVALRPRISIVHQSDAAGSTSSSGDGARTPGRPNPRRHPRLEQAGHRPEQCALGEVEPNRRTRSASVSSFVQRAKADRPLALDLGLARSLGHAGPGRRGRDGRAGAEGGEQRPLRSWPAMPSPAAMGTASPRRAIAPWSPSAARLTSIVA